MKQVTINDLVPKLAAKCDEIHESYIEKASQESDPARKSNIHLDAMWNIMHLCDFAYQLDGLDVQTKVEISQIRQTHVDKAETAMGKLGQQIHANIAKLAKK